MNITVLNKPNDTEVLKYRFTCIISEYMYVWRLVVDYADSIF